MYSSIIRLYKSIIIIIIKMHLRIDGRYVTITMGRPDVNK